MATPHGSRRGRHLPAALLVGLGLAGMLRAQQTVSAPGGTLTGMVRDSTTGLAVGYALVIVVGGEQRVFASESGRFVLTGLSSGRLVLRIQQIGYRAVSVPLAVNAGPGAPGGARGLEVKLMRPPVVLPEVVVQGDVCSGTEALAGTAEGGTLIDEALKNAERLLVLEKSYPFRAEFEMTAVQLDSSRMQVSRRTDTVRYDTRGLSGYRRGRVLERRGPREVAAYFTTSDLAREEFQKWHCLWYAGRDTTNAGRPAHRIDFAPVARVRTPDWAGSLLIDSTTMTLVRSQARLVNLRSRETAFSSVRCTVSYREIVPTLVLESQADCQTSRDSARYPYFGLQWSLTLFRFIGKSPVPPPLP